jgi:hypothetical protein
MVHLSKLAVGIRDVTHLQSVQSRRLADEGQLYHRTRLAPRRIDELLAGGSIYWVIAGLMQARQRVLAVEPSRREDGAPCAGLRLEPVLVLVAQRPVRPFQGWRYLEHADAPSDRTTLESGHGENVIPEAMRRTLAQLGLLEACGSRQAR